MALGRPQWPLRVINGPRPVGAACPFYLQEQTSSG